MANKKKRQLKIKEIISGQSISSQEELAEKLRNQGFDTTQATLSRDLHELGIVRVPDNYGFKYIFHQDDTSQNLKQMIGMEVISVQHNESIIVIKTLPGRAQGVAIYLDKLKDSHIIGTLAGDDSILIIPDSHAHINDVLNRIQEMMTSV